MCAACRHLKGLPFWNRRKLPECEQQGQHWGAPAAGWACATSAPASHLHKGSRSGVWAQASRQAAHSCRTAQAQLWHAAGGSAELALALQCHWQQLKPARQVVCIRPACLRARARSCACVCMCVLVRVRVWVCVCVCAQACEGRTGHELCGDGRHDDALGGHARLHVEGCPVL